jgi:dihydropyrimidinase
VWDADLETTWNADAIHSAVDYTCFDGTTTRGVATHVLSRGTLVIEDGVLTEDATPGRGKFVKRRTFEHTRPGQYEGPTTTREAAHV